MYTRDVAVRGRVLARHLLTALASWMVVGCSGDPKSQPLPFEGVILWQDGSEPRELEGSSVEFESGGSVVATTVLTADGTFRLDQSLSPGTYRVRVTPPPGSSKPSVLDPRFESFDTSGLTFNATSGPQQVNYRVRKRGR